MTSDDFRSYLRNLQNSPYQWPNDYFAWKKPDGSLFMIGIKSSQLYHILRHELEEDRTEKLQKLLNEISPGAKLQYERPYVSVQYSISPNTVHLKHVDNGTRDGALARFDPVEELAQTVSGYEYLGSWRDPDILMDSSYGYSRTLACGRWELAKKHILEPEKKPSLTYKISQAQEKASESAQNLPNGHTQSVPNKGPDFLIRD